MNTPYYENEEHGITVYCGDCLEVMKDIPEGSIDLTVTSPPYDNLRNYNGYVFDFQATAEQLRRVTKSGGIVVWVVGDATINGSETGTSFRQALTFIEVGFNLHDTMIYQKQNFIPLTHNRYEQCFEYMFVFSNGKPKVFNPITVQTKGGGSTENWLRRGYCTTIRNGAQRRRDETRITKETMTHRNIFTYPVGREQCGHPAPFPYQLAKDHILSWSNPNDLVLDPMCGSGTTLLAAYQTGRRCIGIEISEDYCSIAVKRIKEAVAQKTIALEV